MNQRSFDRITLEQFATFYRGKILCTAMVTNISKSGMRINAPILFPLNAKFVMHLSTENKDLKVNVKVARLIKKGDAVSGMGVELSDMPEEYVRFVERLQSADS